MKSFKQFIISLVVYSLILLSFFPSTFQTVKAGAPYDGGTGDGWSMADLSCVLIGTGIASCNNQSFVISDTPTDIGTIYFQFNTGWLPTTANNINLIIPSTFDARWSRAIVATLSGTASGKVNQAISFSTDNKTISLTVKTNFIDTDTLIISGLTLTNFRSFTPSTVMIGCDINGDSTVEYSDWSGTKFVAREVSPGYSPTDSYSGGNEDGWFMFNYAPPTGLPDAVRMEGGTLNIQSGSVQIY